MHNEMWNEMYHPFPNLIRKKLIHVGKSGPRGLTLVKNKGQASVVFALHNVYIINIAPLFISQDFVICV